VHHQSKQHTPKDRDIALADCQADAIKSTTLAHTKEDNVKQKGYIESQDADTRNPCFLSNH
jgi:hypothetical protein